MSINLCETQIETIVMGSFQETVHLMAIEFDLDPGKVKAFLSENMERHVEGTAKQHYARYKRAQEHGKTQ